MKIKKNINKEEYLFKVYPKLRTMTAEVRLMGRIESIECQITEDFKYVIIPETYTVYQFGVGDVQIGNLKFSKTQQIEVKEYNQ